MPPSTTIAFFRSALRGIGSLFFPDLCPCCQREGQWGRCIKEWQGSLSTRYISKVPIVSVVAYDDRAMSVVLAAKERGERRAKDFLITALSSAVSSVKPRISRDVKLFIVPIPSSERAMRRRGEDVILGLSQRVAMKHGPDLYLLPALRWKRVIRDQSELTMRERIENLADSLEVDERLVSESLRIHGIGPAPERAERADRADRAGVEELDLGIIVIDDVITSGSTMAAAISAISHSSLGKRSTMIGITACYSARGL